jgi:hypothetical protein
MTTGITDALTPRPPDEPPPLPEAVLQESPPEIPPVPVAPPKPARWKELIVTVLLAALVGAVVAGGFIVGVEVALGRFSRGVSGGQANLESKTDGNMLTQKGRVTVPAGGKVEVFYPNGYVNPPALTWKTEGRDYFRVSDQAKTGFTVNSNINQAWDFYWEATGVPDKEGGKAGAWKEKDKDGKK